MSNVKTGVVLVFGLFLGMGFVNMAAEAVTGEPLLDGGVDDSSSQAANQSHSSNSWTLPASGDISTRYGIPGDMWISGHHTGIDFPVRSGSRVKAAGSGEVVAAGKGGQYGDQVVIKHPGGIYTQYAHLSEIYVSKGAKVSAGMPIALSGSTGNSTGPHLHFEVRNGPSYGDDIDPVAFLEDHGIKF